STLSVAPNAAPTQPRCSGAILDLSTRAVVPDAFASKRRERNLANFSDAYLAPPQSLLLSALAKIAVSFDFIWDSAKFIAIGGSLFVALFCRDDRFCANARLARNSISREAIFQYFGIKNVASSPLKSVPVRDPAAICCVQAGPHDGTLIS